MNTDRYTVRAAISRWLMLTRAKTNVYRIYGACWSRMWGRRILARLTVADLREWQIKRLKEVKPATVQAQMVVLSNVFEQAIEDGHPVENIVKKLGWLKMDNSRTRWFSADELARIEAHCRSDSWDYILFNLHTGLRVGELLGLEWEDVEGDRIYIRPAKTGKGRWVPLTPSAQRILESRRRLERPFPVGYRSWAKRFENVLKRAGITGATLHVLRHSFASMLVQRGASLYRVKSLLGHSSLKMTERYSHLGQKDLAEAVLLLEE